MNGNQKRNAINPDKFGLWETCEPGVFATAKGTCRICGGGCDAHQVRVSQTSGNLAAGCAAAKSERNAAQGFVVEDDKAQAIVPRSDARYIVLIGRGYTGIRLDYDNLVAASKYLRDAIADKILGTASDAEREGIQWEYRQFNGRGTKIEIYKREVK